MEAVGSVQAQQAFDRGDVDLILVGQLDPPNAAEGVQAMAYAYQVVTVVVPDSNPMQTVDYRQLREIFGDGGRGDQWGRYVEGGAWRTRPIQPLGVRQAGHLSFEIFSQHVLDGRVARSNVRFFDSAEAALQQLRDEVGGIALVPVPEVGEGLRTLPVAVSDEAQAYFPSAENVLFGDYALRLPFYLHWRTGEAANQGIRPLLRECFSEAVLTGLEAQGWMPVAERERQAFLDSIAD